MARISTVLGLCVLLSVAALAHGGALRLGGRLTETCVSQKDSALCDDLDGCTWCVGKIATACYPLSAAKLLPSKFFTCDKLTPSTERSTRSPATDCLAKNETACALPECVWCESAIGGACFTPKDAKKLPPSIVTCSDDDDNGIKKRDSAA